MTVADLGELPLANAYVPRNSSPAAELRYPLHVYACSTCRLVQLGHSESPQTLFGEYAYFSGYSQSWLQHCEAYAARMTADLGLCTGSLVVELASNDGCLLQCFQRRGIAVQGVDPAANVAAAARKNGIPTEVAFFGREVARRMFARGLSADLVTANNVLAHVPDINDFVAGMKILLKPGGVITVEFPHLLRLVQLNQFDTIYHEHVFYFSLETVRRIFAAHALCVTDVEELPTHGGSLRISARHAESNPAIKRSVAGVLEFERNAGLHKAETYRAFAARMQETKRQLRAFLHNAQRAGARVAGYGRPAKATTLLNFCGVDADLIEFTADRNPRKQGHCIPGTRIGILDPEAIFQQRPDYVLILPWNLHEEIVQQLSQIRSWGGRFVLPIPELKVLP